MKLAFRSILWEYVEEHTIVYTDGSKTESGVGSAFVIEGAFHSWILPKVASEYIDELYAVWQALRF